MKRKDRLIKYVMFMVSIVMMLTITIPHHHHESGMPCYASYNTETSTDKDTHNSDKSHDCGCNGHNTALFSSVITHLTDGDINIYLIPLLTIFDYSYPLDTTLFQSFNFFKRFIYNEIIKDLWIGDSFGLRGPPQV